MKEMKDYYPMLVIDRSDDNIDHVVFVNKNISPEIFTKKVDQAVDELFNEGYNYDCAYWDAICEKLKDLDFYTYDAPDTLYY